MPEVYEKSFDSWADSFIGQNREQTTEKEFDSWADKFTDPNRYKREEDKSFDSWADNFTRKDEIQRIADSPENFSYIDEAYRTVGTAVEDLGQSLIDLPYDVGILEGEPYKIPDFVDDPQTMVGQFGATALQFLIPYTGALKGLSIASKLVKGSKFLSSASKGAKTARAMTAGAAADFVAFQPKDGNLTTFLLENTELQPHIQEYLESDDPIDKTTMRLLNAVEGLGLGYATDMIFRGLSKGFRIASHETGKAIQGVPAFQKGLKVVQDAVDKRIDRYIRGTVGFGRLSRRSDEYQRSIGVPDPGREKLFLSLEEEAQMLKDSATFIRDFLARGTQTFRRTLQNGDEIVETGEGLLPIVKRVQDIANDHPTAYQDWEDLLMYSYLDSIEKNQDRLMLNEINKLTNKGMSLKKAHAQAQAKTRRTGFSRQEINDNLTRIRNLPHYQAIAQEKDAFMSFNERVLDLLEDTGMLDKATRSRLDKQHVFLYRKIDFDDQGEPFFTNRLRQHKDPVHKARVGSNKKTKIDNITENVIKGYSQQIESAMVNRVKAMAVRTVETLPKKEQLDWLEKYQPKKHGKQANFMTVFRGGKKERYVIKDPFLLSSVKALGPDFSVVHFKNMFRYGQHAKALLTRGVTMDPAFWGGRNLIRDTLGVSILSRTGFKPFVSTLRGAYHSLASDKHYQEYLRQGGGFGHHTITDAERAMGNYRRYVDSLDWGLRDKPLALSPRAGAAKVIEMADSFIGRFEYAPRVEEFRRLRKQGYSKRKAAYLSRNVSVDFAQRGSSQTFRNITSLVPFLNAHLQGMHRTFQALGVKRLIGHKFTPQESAEVRRVWRRMAMLTLSAGTILPMYHYKSGELFGDESISETYKSIPDYIRRTNVVLVMPKDENGKNTVITMPKPHELAVMETLMESVLANHYNPKEKDAVLDYLWEQFTTSTRSTDMSLLPQVLRAPIEVGLNRKFTGAPIVPGALQELEDGAEEGQYNYRTSATMIAIGEKTGFSPMKMEHLVTSFTGKLGEYVLRYLTDPVARKQMGLPTPAEERRFYTEAFVRETPFPFTQDEQDFYNYFNDSQSRQELFEDVSTNLNDFTTEKFNEMLEDEDTMALIQSHGLLAGTLKQIGALNSAIKTIEAMSDEAMPVEEKIEQVKSYTETKQQLIREVNKVYLDLLMEARE